MELGLVGCPPQTVVAVDKTDHVRMDEQTWIKRGTLETTLEEAFGKVLTPDMPRGRMAKGQVLQTKDPLAIVRWGETFEIEFIVKGGLGKGVLETDTTCVKVANRTGFRQLVTGELQLHLPPNIRRTQKSLEGRTVDLQQLA